MLAHINAVHDEIGKSMNSGYAYNYKENLRIPHTFHGY